MIIIEFCLSLDTKKLSLKDNHRGVIDKILAIQDRHETNFAPYVAFWEAKVS